MKPYISCVQQCLSWQGILTWLSKSTLTATVRTLPPLPVTILWQVLPGILGSSCSCFARHYLGNPSLFIFFVSLPLLIGMLKLSRLQKYCLCVCVRPKGAAWRRSMWLATQRHWSDHVHQLLLDGVSNSQLAGDWPLTSYENWVPSMSWSLKWKTWLMDFCSYCTPQKYMPSAYTNYISTVMCWHWMSWRVCMWLYLPGTPTFLCPTL